MRKPYCCVSHYVNKCKWKWTELWKVTQCLIKNLHRTSLFPIRELLNSGDLLLYTCFPLTQHQTVCPLCPLWVPSQVSAVITHPSYPVWGSLDAERWAVGLTDSASTVFQAWWTEKCWSRWSGATGCRVLRAARSRYTKWCGSVGRKSQMSGPPSSTSSPSWRTTLPPLSHSTSPETTCRDPLRGPETHHHVLISHRDGSQTHCGTSSQQLPCTLVLTEICGCFRFFSHSRIKCKTHLSQHDLCRQAVLCLRMCVWWSWWGRTCVWGGLKQDHVMLPELCWADILHRRQRESWKEKRWASCWWLVHSCTKSAFFLFFYLFVFILFTWTLNPIVKSVFLILTLFICLFPFYLVF